jgi:hypothetical protein
MVHDLPVTMSRWMTALAVVGLGLAVAGCGDDSNAGPSTEPPLATTEDTEPPSTDAPTSTTTAPRDSSECGYLYEWAASWRFPLQPDPHAAYTYVVPKITDEPIAYEVSGDLPRAAWTSWMTYTGVDQGVQPYSLVKGASIEPENDGINNFVPDNLVLEENRVFRLLVLPDGVDQSTVAESLQSIPASNVLTSPTEGDAFVIANRVYGSFETFNPGGAGGLRNIPFPTTRAVNYETGEPVDCSDLNLVPDPRSADDMPTERLATSTLATLEDDLGISVGPGPIPGREGAEYAPQLDPDLIEFTRPPLLAGADVSSIPPVDSCAGYLGAATSTNEVGLIRLPHVATWFDTRDIDEQSVFVQQEATYISMTQYGNAVGSYEPGSPDSGSLANHELLVDETGGSTVVVWPRSLSEEEQQAVFDKADAEGWAIIRGDEEGPVVSSNLFVRLKGADESYTGGYEPTDEVDGVPCFFDDNPDATAWSDVTGDEYIASGANIGPGAPMGVNCSVEEVLDDRCRSELEAYMESTGNPYVAASD